MAAQTEPDRSLARPTGPRHRREPAPRKRSRLLSFVIETATVTCLALIITVVLRMLVVEAFYVPSESMYATLTTDDRILAEKISYLHRGVERGDIVVFADPGNWLQPTEVKKPGAVRRFGEFVGVLPRKGRGHLVKRVIGIGGDTVVCCDGNDRITVNGIALDETPYLAGEAKPSTVRFRVKVPADKLWLMGDNRPESADSRAHLGGPGGGFVPVDDVVGRACCVIWPSDRMTRLRRPPTFENPGLTK